MIADWEQLSQKDRDHKASPSAWSNRYSRSEAVKGFVSAIVNGTEATHKCTRLECDISYGEGKMQTINIFRPEIQQEDCPVLVFFHGGYWQATSKEQYGLVAMHPTKHGAIVALVGYTLAPTGTLPQMLREAELAVLFLARKFPRARFYLSGHSAGGQLAAMLLSIDWSKKHGLPKDFIKGAFLFSGVFDVRPLVRSYVNDPLNLTDEDAYRVSPITPENLSEAIRLSSHCRVVSICGEHDPPMFKQMAEDYTKELVDGGLDAVYQLMPGMDHFEPVERLVDAENPATKMLLHMLL